MFAQPALGVVVMWPKSARAGSRPTGPKQPMPIAAKAWPSARHSVSWSPRARRVSVGVVVGTRERCVIVEPRASTASALVPPSSTPAITRSLSATLIGEVRSRQHELA